MPNAPHYPLFLDLCQKPVLIVGGGEVGLRKAKSLIECAARVTVVAPEVHAGFEKLTGIERIEAPYAPAYMAQKKWRLVFAATSVPEVNAAVQRDAAAARIFCCRADEPEEGDFTSGAHVHIGAAKGADGSVAATRDTGGILVAVTTSGASPVLAARICREIAAGMDPMLPQLAELLAPWRLIVKQNVANMEIRRALLQRLAGEELETILRTQGPAAATQAFHRWLDEARQAARASPSTPPPSPVSAARGEK